MKHVYRYGIYDDYVISMWSNGILDILGLNWATSDDAQACCFAFSCGHTLQSPWRFDMFQLLGWKKSGGRPEGQRVRVEEGGCHRLCSFHACFASILLSSNTVCALSFNSQVWFIQIWFRLCKLYCLILFLSQFLGLGDWRDWGGAPSLGPLVRCFSRNWSCFARRMLMLKISE